MRFAKVTPLIPIGFGKTCRSQSPPVFGAWTPDDPPCSNPTMLVTL